MQFQLTAPMVVNRTVSTFTMRLDMRMGDGDQYALAHVSLHYSDGGVHDHVTLPFTKEELDTWGEDDSVLVDLIQTKLAAHYGS